MSRVLMIAEAGVNHDGSLDRAIALVEAAARCGADVVKFQTFRADALATASAPKAEYQKHTTSDASQLEMLRRLELSHDDHRRVMDACERTGIEFMSSPFDPESLRFLAEDCGVRRLKLGSGELTNAPLLLQAARTGLPLIVSTGMSTLGEVEDALGVLAFGRLTSHRDRPSRAAFRAALTSAEGRRSLATSVVLLHCVSQYPAPSDQVNLRAIDTMRTAFGLPVGYSDHTDGPTMSIAAVARGAAAIEKHLTLDRSASGPDHAASMEPDDLAALVRQVREVEAALGDGAKVPVACERDTAAVARKGVVAARVIRRGTPLTLEDLAVKRPARGASPIDLWDLVGRTASADYAPDDPIDG
jgi:N-acetylneuraminate synthase